MYFSIETAIRLDYVVWGVFCHAEAGAAGMVWQLVCQSITLVYSIDYHEIFSVIRFMTTLLQTSAIPISCKMAKCVSIVNESM